MQTITDIREIFKEKLHNEDFVTDKTGVKTIEIIGSSFIANEPSIFGTPNEEYIKREIEWYVSESLYVEDIPGKTPDIWNQVSSKHGRVNSNYGHLINSKENHYQVSNVIKELKSNPDSRRANMIYTRPTMHDDYNTDGMSDFICTNNVQYVIRDNKVHAIVNMRSNDLHFGYLNDYAWQKFVLEALVDNLQPKPDFYVGCPEDDECLKPGNIYWQTGSLHLYQRHFYLVDHYSKTGEIHILKRDYTGKYQA